MTPPLTNDLEPGVLSAWKDSTNSWYRRAVSSSALCQYILSQWAKRKIANHTSHFHSKPKLLKFIPFSLLLPLLYASGKVSSSEHSSSQQILQLENTNFVPVQENIINEVKFQQLTLEAGNFPLFVLPRVFFDQICSSEVSTRHKGSPPGRLNPSCFRPQNNKSSNVFFFNHRITLLISQLISWL